MSINVENQLNSNVWVLLWLLKKYRKIKIILHEFRQLYSLHKTEDIYPDNTKDLQTKFSTSN